jgi:hypothetical protein
VSGPEWFAAFLADRGTRKPSAHTLKAYRQEFDAITAIIVGGVSSQIRHRNVSLATRGQLAPEIGEAELAEDFGLGSRRLIEDGSG